MSEHYSVYVSDACYNFMGEGLTQHVKDTVIFSTIFVLVGYLGWWRRRHTIRTAPVEQQKLSKMDRVVAWAFLLVFAAEVTYKYLSSQMVFLLQPCHVVTVVELYFLFARSSLSETLFNANNFFLWGPLLAVLLPETDCLHLPGEVLVYWVQHAFILLTPIYLMVRNRYRVQSGSAMFILSYALFGLYHCTVLLWAGLYFRRNLNFMLCPEFAEVWPGDFLHDQWYRWHALWYFAVGGAMTGYGVPALANVLRWLIGPAQPAWSSGGASSSAPARTKAA